MCQNLTRTFGVGRTAKNTLAEVTCTVWPAARIAVTGPSGSGKSTLLHVMAGLESSSSGTVTWPGLDGHPLARPGRIGVVFQGPSLVPALTVSENVALPMLLGDTTRSDAAQRSRVALDRLGIGDLATSLPEELSGGQAQRVAVARVLAAAPRLILADEPTGQLDHQTAAMVLDVMLQTADELGAALVVSTHDPEIAKRLATRWTMRDGTLLDLQPVSASEPR
ncbi:ABC transporter ATP-binding protein [Rhodococcus sp. 1168]|uniref:ABC transporter ATP-binding protein n=1 Tax=Rhodococcus sp. 1168 TaxID=2018041 RepID=UPI000A0B8CA1|nr:ATP-binding cassette domain-containing protein [Rhodococcus sp. 1168]ORI13506.1 ABC transporter ATP-binding protein [Rhodococcus sp. 1168]